MSNNTPEEPSIEEILASIRQIISDDDQESVQDDVIDEPVKPAPKAAAKPAPQPAAQPAPAPKPAPRPEPQAKKVEDDILDDLDAEDDDILELSETLEDTDEEDYVPGPRIQVDLQDADDFADEGNETLTETKPVIAETPKAAPAAAAPSVAPAKAAAEAPAPTTTDSGLLTETAASAVMEGFARLTNQLPIDRSGTGTITLEDIVRELLRPMLRDWLDMHLPPLVEKLVQKELEKVARRAGDE